MLSDYKLEYMGWKGNMTIEEMVSHLNIINPRKSKIQEMVPEIEKVKICQSNDETANIEAVQKLVLKGITKDNDATCEDDRFITDDIREMRKCKCKICGYLILSSEIRHHMERKHKVPMNKCGPIKDINNSFYR